MSEIVFLGLGSNLGDRLLNLEHSLTALKSHPQIKLLAQSAWLENPAIGDAGPNDFLNGIIKISSGLEPRDLLNLIKRIEQSIDPERDLRGRTKARKIDIDILIYGQRTIDEEGLKIPHPRMYQRDFVMKPLQELGFTPQNSDS